MKPASRVDEVQAGGRSEGQFTVLSLGVIRREKGSEQHRSVKNAKKGKSEADFLPARHPLLRPNSRVNREQKRIGDHVSTHQEQSGTHHRANHHVEITG